MARGPGLCVKLASQSRLSARARRQSQSCGGHDAANRCSASFVTSASVWSSRKAKSRPMGAKQQFVHGNKRSFGTSLWKSRSLRHRLEHRWNVTRLFLGGRITLRTAWFGLAHAHLVVALEVRAPARGMVVVCPAAAQEYFTHEMDERLNFGGLGRGSQDRLFS